MVYSRYTDPMPATTIKVSSELRDRLNAEARRANTTVAGVIEGLVAERERAERFRAMREAMSSASAAELDDYQRDVDEWDTASRDTSDDESRL